MRSRLASLALSFPLCVMALGVPAGAGGPAPPAPGSEACGVDLTEGDSACATKVEREEIGIPGWSHRCPRDRVRRADWSPRRLPKRQ